MRYIPWEFAVICGLIVFALVDLFVWNVPIVTWLGDYREVAGFTLLGMAFIPVTLVGFVNTFIKIPQLVKRVCIVMMCAGLFLYPIFVIHCVTNDQLLNYDLVDWIFGK